MGTPESEPQVPDTRTPHSANKRPRPPPPAIDLRPGVPSSASAGPAAQAGTRALKRKVSRGPGLRVSSGKRVRVGQNGDSEGDPFGSDEEEFMEAARAARTSAGGWERGVEAENYPSGLSAEDSGRILDRIRALEEKARDIVGEISALKTYFLH